MSSPAEYAEEPAESGVEPEFPGEDLCPWSGRALDRLQRELAPPERDRFDAHLGGCYRCREELEDVRATLARVRGGLDAWAREIGPPSGALASSVLDRIAPASAPPHPVGLGATRARPRSQTVTGSRLLAAAATLLFALVGIGIVSRGLRPRPGAPPDPRGSTARGPLASASPDTEQPRRRARSWIASVQEADGSWAPGRWGGVEGFRVALTSLSTLALADSDDPVTTVARHRGVDYLRSRQDPDGLIGAGGTGPLQELYGHALATLALTEASEATDRDTRVATREADVAAREAVGYLCQLCEVQKPEGRWRAPWEVGRRRGGETVGIWAIQALAAASRRGWREAEAPLERSLAWFERREARPSPSLASGSHRGPGAEPGTRSAARGADGSSDLSLPDVALARALARSARPGSHLRRRVIDDLLRRWIARPARPDASVRESYFLVKALALTGAPRNAARGDIVRRELLATRRRSGPARGTWDPVDAWGPVGGRLYSTALATLALGTGRS